MGTTLSLDGEWQLTGYGSGEAAKAGGEAEFSLAATVPGDVHLDLLRTGQLPDPYFSENALECQWVAEKWWTYRRTFTLEAGDLGDRDTLVFEGIDTYATVLLNGEAVAETDNMHVPWRFDVTGKARVGENTLEVRFLPPLLPMSKRDASKYSAAFFTNYRVFDRKMQCSYGWDWCHRFLNIGLWRSVRFESARRGRIDDVFVRVGLLESNRALVDVDVACEALTAHADPTVRVVIEDAGGVEQARWEAKADGHLSTTLTVVHPRYWWPNGDGDQYLYTARVSLLEGGEERDTRTIPFGMRTVDILEEPDAVGASFTVRINGEKRFMKGADWVPMDSFPASVTPERYREVLTLFRDAHFNMLRVWGGGIYEAPAFYEICTELGILLWHDFMFACAEYPEDDPDFLAKVERELPLAFRALRNHTCIAVWCGNNENGMNHPTGKYYYGKHLYEGFLRRLFETDPSRPHRITTPYGGEQPNGSESGTTHWGAWMECTRTPEPENFTKKLKDWGGRFQAEIHIKGAPPERSLARFLTEAELADPLGSAWLHHSKDNPHGGCDLNMLERLDLFASTWYGAPDARRGRAALRAYQLREMVARHAEEHRRQMYHCSGALFWMSHDCWPAVSGALVDYYMAQTAGYFGAKHAFQPVLVSGEIWEDTARVVLCNDLREAFDAVVDVETVDFAGTVHWADRLTCHVPANAATTVFEAPLAEIMPEPCHGHVLTARLYRDDVLLGKTVVLPLLPREMAIPDITLSAEIVERTGTEVTLALRAGGFAHVVTIDPEGNLPGGPHDPTGMPEQWDAVVLSDNYFHLLAGEERNIHVRLRYPGKVERLTVRAWNADPVAVSLG